MHYIIGIDEAGRGPWAGPVVAGGCMIAATIFSDIRDIFPWLDDSKKLSEKMRENFYNTLEFLAHENRCHLSFSYRDADRIDTIGIRNATKESIEDVILSLLQFLSGEDTYEIWIDGCDNFVFESFHGDYRFAKKHKKYWWKALDDGSGEETVWVKRKSNEEYNNSLSYLIHGDSLHPIISLASIIAKVIRDRMMCEYNEDFPEYGFKSHKGYGTRKHQEALINYGITFLHRKSYAPVKRLISGLSRV